MWNKSSIYVMVAGKFQPQPYQWRNKETESVLRHPRIRRLSRLLGRLFPGHCVSAFLDNEISISARDPLFPKSIMIPGFLKN